MNSQEPTTPEIDPSPGEERLGGLHRHLHRLRDILITHALKFGEQERHFLPFAQRFQGLANHFCCFRFVDHSCGHQTAGRFGHLVQPER